MIILFEKNETRFTTLGLGVLKDAINCHVKEELNGVFELEMEYPLIGSHYKDIALERILFTKPNTYDYAQPFRIYSISKPLSGIVTINAEHISYDMNGYIVKPFTGNGIADSLTKIQNGAFPSCPFVVSTNMQPPEPEQFKLTKPCNLRSVLLGQNDSVLESYGGEVKYNKFDVEILSRRGLDRGVSIKYGKNLTDIESEDTSSGKYTGIFPFYSATVNETKTESTTHYQATYIVPETIPFASNWLSLFDGGESLIPLEENSPIEIRTEGEYFNKVCYFREATVSDETLIMCYIRSDTVELSSDWLSTTIDGDALVPTEKIIYKIQSNTLLKNQTYIYNEGSYVRYTGNGFYYEYAIADRPEPTIRSIISSKEKRDVYVDLANDEALENGIIPIEDMEEEMPKKIFNLDLTDKFNDIPTEEQLKIMALDYVNDNDFQEIKNSLTISFIKMSDTIEYEYLKDLEVVQLGDNVLITHTRLGVKSKRRVISTEYDVLNDSFTEIKLGNKSANITDTLIVSGDNVSTLKNDAKFADDIAVVNLLVQNLTADYITGINARLSNAQIEQLKTERIEVKGIIEASEGYLDKLIAQLLIAENAEIKNALKAGTIDVQGKITALSGVIGGCQISEDGKLLISTSIKIGLNEDGTYNFSVDPLGNAKATSLEINGGSIKLGKNEDGSYKFSVDPLGNVKATSFNFSQSGIVQDAMEQIPTTTTILNGVISTNVIEFNNDVKLISQNNEGYKYHTIHFNVEPLIISQGGLAILKCFVTLNFYDIGGNLVGDDSVYDNIEFRATLRVIHNYGSTYVPVKYTFNYGMNGKVEIYSDAINIPISKIHGVIVESYSPEIGVEMVGSGSGLMINSNFIPKNDGVNTLGDSDFRWGEIYCANSTINTSDKNLKKEIDYDISKYGRIFDELKPVSFKFIDGSSNRTHLGFVAQDIEKILNSNNIDSKDFALFIKSLKTKNKNKNAEDLTDDDYVYGIRYSELHAMEIKEIQDLKKQVKMLTEMLIKKEE